jgi:hypothetical protein
MNLVEKRLGLLLNHFKNLLGHSFTLQGLTLAQDFHILPLENIFGFTPLNLQQEDLKF